MRIRERIDQWFAQQGWQPFDFQKDLWQAYAAGESGLLHAPTGQGKTLAAFLAPLLAHTPSGPAPSVAPLTILWLTPLRALASDTAQSLERPLLDLDLPWTVATRTGDTSATQRKKLKQRLPSCLVTTPESLALFLTYPETRQRFRHLRCVIVDEWHELMGTKRGVQTELNLARLRAWLPELRTWGLSATLGNLDEAREALLGSELAQRARTLQGRAFKKIEIETLLPEEIERFPWSGHLGIRMLPQVVKRLHAAHSTLLFTNTRSQSEIWFQALLDFQPELAGRIALHHGSIDRKARQLAEEGLKQGDLLAVVCTSSLDLGVDFSPVDQVVQIGSPKGIARLLQRAGRSGHAPGQVSRILGVPTNAFELVEFAAARDSLEIGQVEPRTPLRNSLDVLVQHLVTCALGGGFEPAAMQKEVLSSHAFAELSEADWEWALRFVTTGGRALGAYPHYRKVVELEGLHRVTDRQLAQTHRMTIGTITSDTAISVRYANGQRLGTVEEWFISGIKPGGQFAFSGKRLELVRFRDLVATVKPASQPKKGQIPSWQGGKAPLSSELALAVAERLAQPASPDDPIELSKVRPILDLQQSWSHLPSRERLLIELTETREGQHAFLYPFAGRLAHEGLGNLVAFRLARENPASISISVNDYGFELRARQGLFLDRESWRQALVPANLLDDLLACLNTAELAKHHFREISRVAGLVLQGFPGQPKSNRSLQASSGLLYEVFAQYDPENRLLGQARREILERQLDLTRLKATLERLETIEIDLLYCPRLTPLAFPLWAQQLHTHLSTEDATTRLENMLADLTQEASRGKVESPEVLS
ncbi:MAG: ligase-associated DNA damage response DEXH box helicase [Verrucomicrobiota bacterium]